LEKENKKSRFAAAFNLLLHIHSFLHSVGTSLRIFSLEQTGIYFAKSIAKVDSQHLPISSSAVCLCEIL